LRYRVVAGGGFHEGPRLIRAALGVSITKHPQWASPQIFAELETARKFPVRQDFLPTIFYEAGAQKPGFKGWSIE